MTLKEVDSSKLLFDIHSEDLVEQFKKKFPEFESYEGKVDEVKVCQYIILMYDLHSPMVYDKPEYIQRKYACALMVKFPTYKKEFTEDAERILIGENDIVNQTVVSFILSYGLPSFGLFQTYSALIAFEMQKVYGGKATKDTQNILDKATAKLQSLERELFRSGDQDEYTKVKQILYARAEREREKLRPEQIIRFLEDNNALPDDFNQYGDDYKIDLAKDLQFIGDGSSEKK